MSPLHDEARRLLSSTLVWDNHACMPLRPHDTSLLDQLSRYRDVGVNVVSLNVGFGEQGIEEHVRMLAHLRRWLAARPEQYRLLTTPEDLRRLEHSAALGVCFDIEGMNAVADQPSLVELYYDLGVRWMLVAYNVPNRAGGGCQGDGDPGLTPFGRAVIDEMNRVGMVVCCSHTAPGTAMQVIEHSRAPVIFSHSNPRSVYQHPRNISDELMVRCARKGGVIGINGVGLFLGAFERLAQAVAKHIDYAIRLVGFEHVALGLDYVFDQSELDEYVRTMAERFPAALGYSEGMALLPPEGLPEVVAELLAMGHSADAIAHVLGRNWLRIAEQVWR